MLRVFRYRLSPTKGQELALRRTLGLLRELYNGALQERRDAYSKQGVTLSAYAQMRELIEVRALRPEFAEIHTHLLHDPITRLDRAYQAFFRRCKAGEKPGYPRFKGFGRYRTFTFSDAANHNGVRLMAGGKRVKLTGIGNVKIKLHRPTQGRIKQAHVSLSGDGHWYIGFVCDDVPAKPLPPTGKTVGIDVGIKEFATFNDGSPPIHNPRFFETAQKDLAVAHRRVSHCKRGSHRRRKMVVLLAKRHDRVRRQRLNFHHTEANKLVEKYDAISVEKLNLKGLVKGRLSKQILDAAWGQFTRILASKAECAGREYDAVDPYGTTQECSRCHERVQKTLKTRVHDCPHCGLVLDRDVNAAINIEGRGQRLRGEKSILALSRIREAPSSRS